MAKQDEASDSEGPLIDDNVIRIQLRKPSHRKWELRTRNHSPSIRFPTIQLFDCEGNLLVETNDENISLKSSDFDDCSLKTTQSLKERDFRHIINKNGLKKHNTISGGKIYTRVYRRPPLKDESKVQERYILRDDNGVTNIPNKLIVANNNSFSRGSSFEVSSVDDVSQSLLSSFKSSDNDDSLCCQEIKGLEDLASFSKHKYRENFYSDTESTFEILNDDEPNCFSEQKKGYTSYALVKSKSFTNNNDTQRQYQENDINRSKSGIIYKQPNKKVSFLNTYLKSLPNLTSFKNNWLSIEKNDTKVKETIPEEHKEAKKNNLDECRFCKTQNNIIDNSFDDISTDLAVQSELKKRLRMYRRGISELERRWSPKASEDDRRNSCGNLKSNHTSSSESVDEADLVLNRLKRRIVKNKMREQKKTIRGPRVKRQSSGEGWQDVSGAGRAAVRLKECRAMGSNISQHSTKGLKGRRARSSGDLCNGDTKSQSESSVCGSVVGDVMGWNRSLPNHLDGNRHLADYSRVNNNYGEFGTYNRTHPKGRALRYRVFNSGTDAEPVWKLQDPGCDQGYGSERSPEEDFAPPIQPSISLEEYEGQLRAIYPFINDENSFTVVVEKDGRGLGMSVCGGGGLVRIRRLYPPQPAWRTGRLAPRDLLLAANGVPLAGLSTLEALEVLRTAAPRVELRVCRPPPDVLESVTPPDPPTPPARTPHPPHVPLLDPLNCHPMHARLSATTSSATTSSSEGRGRRDGSPEDRSNLHLRDLDRPLPVYDIQYGEFDIVMSKVNGSLGFTLRKEDHSALGHYVRALVREPALSDGRIQPGDRIVAVNDTPMSNMSHAEAVAFLRACDSEVRLRLYRDHAATPLSPMSPKEEGPTDSDGPCLMGKPKPPLRAEAVSMLCDLAARRLTPDTVDGSRSPCLSPRKFRRLTKESNHYEQPNDCSSPKHTIESNRSEGRSSDDGRMQRAHSMTLASPASPQTSRKQKLSLTVHGYELNNLDNAALDAPNVYQDNISHKRFQEPTFPINDEPVSMPVEHSDTSRFKHANPVYQSAVLTSATSNEGGSSDGLRDDGLVKWKGATLSPEKERKKIMANPSPKEADVVQKENVEPEPPKVTETSSEPTIVTVELNRGWNSRLGFSVQSHPESGQSYISAVYNDSVAARDGRLHPGDVILQVNDENVTSMKTPEVIELLRILRGSICITVLRPPKP